MLKHILLAAVAATAFGTVPVASSAQAIVIREAPPPMREERIPEARRGWEWAPGHWAWRHGQYVWVEGHWLRERHGMHWVPERWAERNGHWEMVAGHWERGHRDYDRRMGAPGWRDNDRDGVPNRYDAHPNDPYRR
jgi:hypothetical protein